MDEDVLVSWYKLYWESAFLILDPTKLIFKNILWILDMDEI